MEFTVVVYTRQEKIKKKTLINSIQYRSFNRLVKHAQHFHPTLFIALVSDVLKRSKK